MFVFPFAVLSLGLRPNVPSIMFLLLLYRFSLSVFLFLYRCSLIGPFSYLRPLLAAVAFFFFLNRTVQAVAKS